MRYALKDWLWTSKSISEELGKNNSEWFTKKFGYILDKLDVPQKYFKTKHKKGQFIFSNKEAPEKINEIFTIFEKGKGYITFQEKEIVINNLVEILPVCSSSEEIEQLIKETEEMRKNTKIDTPVRLEFDESDLHDYRNDADYVIGKSVEQYYLNIIVEEDFVFKKKIYFEVNASLITRINDRKKIYGYQYKLIKKWSDKWEFIMNEVKKVRIAERFDLLYQVSKTENRIIKIPHHGSKYSISEELYSRYDFDIAVISCGADNRYGHPHADLLDVLDKCGVRIQRTDIAGAIVLVP